MYKYPTYINTRGAAALGYYAQIHKSNTCFNSSNEYAWNTGSLKSLNSRWISHMY